MTARRYESGKLVGETPSSGSKLGWGKKCDTSRTEKPIAAEVPQTDPETPLPAAAEVMSSPPPCLSAPATRSKESRPAGPPATAPAVDEPIHDTSDMRKFLLKQMVRAAKGEISTETVKNIVTLSQQVYNATSLELKAAAILKNTDKSICALELVSPQNNGDK